MSRPIAVLCAALLTGSTAIAEEAARPAPQVDPPEQHDAAAQTILEACTEIVAADSIERLGEVAGPIVDRANQQRDMTDIALTRAAEEYYDAMVAFSSARTHTNRTIVKFLETAADFALYEASRPQAERPMIVEELTQAIDDFIGEGTAAALENPHTANFLNRDAAIDAAFEAEHEARDALAAARRKVVDLETRLNVGKAIATGILVCLDDQENYLNASLASVPAELSPAGGYRMDALFDGAPSRSFDIPAAQGDIPYSPAPCHDACMAAGDCVGWNYTYDPVAAGLPPARCAIYEDATTLGATVHEGGFSGYGPKAVELGLAAPAAP